MVAVPGTGLVDHAGGGIRAGIAAELPETFAHAGTAAAMHAQADRRGQVIGLHHQRRQPGGQAIGFVLKRGELAQKTFT